TPGFGLTVTLPAVVGSQRAAEILYTGRRFDGAEAFAFGLCDHLVAADQVDDEARRLAEAVAASAPLAVASIRRTLRGALVAGVGDVLAEERREQDRLMATEDFREGLRAAKHRRAPAFRGV
ncbi:MAG TPA: enoyl-CoA hydratase-related protein, partial [Acidimicrobiia bacterium]|nr:enoyl-CoA hydratase-related protein [Acidimicrobiia bacterium]